MIETVRQSDLRVSLLLVLVNATVVIVCTKEIAFVALLILAFIWLCLHRQPGKGFKLVAGYALLSLISHLTTGVRGIETIWILANLLRHMLIPIAYTFGLSEAPTGTLLTVFHRLGLPKSFGIATVVLLRFFPTIGYELQAIRTSQKFRGTGIGFWSTLAHLPANFERTMVPLLIRTTKISEELSAAAMVRGVRVDNRIVSYEEVVFRPADIVVTLLYTAFACVIVSADKLNWLEVVL